MSRSVFTLLGGGGRGVGSTCAGLGVGLKIALSLLVRRKTPLVSALPLALICLNDAYQGNTKGEIFAGGNFNPSFRWVRAAVLWGWQRVLPAARLIQNDPGHQKHSDKGGSYWVSDTG